jgi:cardiolipin synthase C
MRLLHAIILSVFILMSCSFPRTRIPKKGEGSGTNIFADTTNIYKAFELSAAGMKTKTGVYTLENGGKSLITRLWLFNHARRSIDIQYYSFSKDVTGLIATDCVVRAADRGVKIRLLIDDAASRMYSSEIKMLNSHDNIEIRVYNAGIKLGRPDRRLKHLAKNSDRLLRRMHNKTLTIDDDASIIGGRNIADEYFDYHHKYNFRDRDVLILGKAVSLVKNSFEKFWNDPLTVPFTDLSGNGNKKKYKDPARFDRLHRYTDETKDFSENMRENVKHFADTFKTIQKTGKLFWTDHVSYISDEPGKNRNRPDRKGGVCTDSLINLVRAAKKTLDIQSPYFIVTEMEKDLLREAIRRGVKIRVLTNSLAAMDNESAFSAYQKDRAEILQIGVEIYEFKPDPKERYDLMIPEVQKELNYEPVYGFHSKTMLIDAYTTVIGSYNFDPRSANYNTECIAVIRSVHLAKHISKYIEEEFLPENSWHTTPEYNPDKEAGVKKQVKAAAKRIVPKKIL